MPIKHMRSRRVIVGEITSNKCWYPGSTPDTRRWLDSRKEWNIAYGVEKAGIPFSLQRFPFDLGWAIYTPDMIIFPPWFNVPIFMEIKGEMFTKEALPYLKAEALANKTKYPVLLVVREAIFGIVWPDNNPSTDDLKNLNQLLEFWSLNVVPNIIESWAKFKQDDNETIKS